MLAALGLITSTTEGDSCSTFSGPLLPLGRGQIPWLVGGTASSSKSWLIGRWHIQVLQHYQS